MIKDMAKITQRYTVMTVKIRDVQTLTSDSLLVKHNAIDPYIDSSYDDSLRKEDTIDAYVDFFRRKPSVKGEILIEYVHRRIAAFNADAIKATIWPHCTHVYQYVNSFDIHKPKEFRLNLRLRKTKNPSCIQTGSIVAFGKVEWSRLSHYRDTAALPKRDRQCFEPPLLTNHLLWAMSVHGSIYLYMMSDDEIRQFK
jgi:hypothetical protein